MDPRLPEAKPPPTQSSSLGTSAGVRRRSRSAGEDPPPPPPRPPPCGCPASNAASGSTVLNGSSGATPSIDIPTAYNEKVNFFNYFKNL